jgi:hypothetical protein
MMSKRFTTRTLLAAACGMGFMSSNAQAFFLTEAIEAEGANRYSAVDHTSTGYDQIGDQFLLSGSVGPAAGAFGTLRNTTATFIFPVPNVVDPFTDITAASIGGSLFQDATAVGFNMDMVLMGYTAANPGQSFSDYEDSINQAISNTDVLIDNWATPASVAGVALGSVDMLSYIQNNYIAGGGFIKIGMTMDAFPAVGTQPTGRYRALGTGTDAMALTINYDNGLVPPVPTLANFNFNQDTGTDGGGGAVPQTGVTNFFSTDDNDGTTATNAESGLFVVDSALGVPAKSLFHGDPKWIVLSEADALSQGGYVGFSVTPDNAGEALDLSELTFDLQADELTGATAAGMGDWALYGDLDASDGLNTFVKLIDGTNTAEGSSSDPLSWENISVDLSGAQYQGLTDGVAFRLYRWNSGGVPLNAVVNSRMDNLILRGVPEPASLILMGLGGLAFLKRRAV